LHVSACRSRILMLDVRSSYNFPAARREAARHNRPRKRGDQE